MPSNPGNYLADLGPSAPYPLSVHAPGDLYIVKYSVKHANGTFSPTQYRFRNADGRLLRFEDQNRLLRIVARLWCEVGLRD